jgi:hypothetical protein
MIPITHPFRKVREKDGAPGLIRHFRGYLSGQLSWIIGRWTVILDL